MILRILACIFVLGFSSMVAAEDRYLDSSATGANDGTSWTDAWESFADVNFGTLAGEVGPDDTLYISGGTTTKTYNITSTIAPRYGSLGHITTVKISEAAGHNGVAIIDGGDSFDPLLELTNYITIDGTVAGDTRTLFGEVTAYKPHIKLQNWGGGVAFEKVNAIHGAGTRTGYTLKGVWVYNDDYICDAFADDSTDCANLELKQGMYNSYAVDAVVSDNEFDGCLGISMAVGNNSTVFSSNLVEKNLITTYYNQAGYGGADAIRTVGGADVRYNYVRSHLASNAFYDSGADGSQHIREDGIQMGPGESYVKIHSNKLMDSTNSVIRVDTQSGSNNNHIWIWNNLIGSSHTLASTQRGFDFDGNSLGTSDTATGIKIYNNTFLDFPLYTATLRTGASTTDLEFVNNLVINGDASSPYYPITIDDICADSGHVDYGVRGDTTDRAIDYNLLLSSDLSTENFMYHLEDTVVVSQTNNPYDSEEVMEFTSYTPNSLANDLNLPLTATMAIGVGDYLGADYEDDMVGTSRGGMGTLWDLGMLASGQTTVDPEPEPAPTSGRKMGPSFIGGGLYLIKR